MRVAILADFPLSSLEGGALGRGGGQGCTWLPQLALSFANMPDLEIHWLILNRTRGKDRVVESHGQYFHELRGVPFRIELALGNRPACWKLGRALARIQPDVVHAWGSERLYPAALKFAKVPTILSMQGILSEYWRIGGLSNTWCWRRMVAAEPGMLRSATVVTCESQWGIDRVREVHPEADCRMVEYGVHPDFFELEWTPSKKEPYALFVGGSDWRKGYDILIAALKQIPDRSWEVRFAGDERIAEPVAQAGLDKVQCLGLLAWPEMKRQLQGAWCSVLPTRGDTSANSVKEARVVGLPVVASKHGGHTGYLEDGVNGRIVDPLDPEGLATGLREVMEDFSRAQSLGAGRHAEDRAYLRPERTAAGFAAIYRELAIGG